MWSTDIGAACEHVADVRIGPPRRSPRLPYQHRHDCVDHRQIVRVLIGLVDARVFASVISAYPTASIVRRFCRFSVRGFRPPAPSSSTPDAISVAASLAQPAAGVHTAVVDTGRREVVLDTNVFVAAGFNRGSHSAWLVEAVRDGRLRMVWDNATRAEI